MQAQVQQRLRGLVVHGVRAGWYAYDFIDNGGHHGAERILPNYQNVGVGSVLPALPGATDVFMVAQCEPEHSLVLAWRLPSGKNQTTWAFVLEEPNRERALDAPYMPGMPGIDQCLKYRHSDNSKETESWNQRK